ncbi:RIO1 family regulatory kinase/ATPase [Promicromonospora sp. NPDC050880]|uniref:RIO1 family regulatory kinase/ATPase domain-containing protein n=1 Tax=Promicromonospora sp. NPDC050880 TaxID=3364406 RepID=UPI00378D5BD4
MPRFPEAPKSVLIQSASRKRSDDRRSAVGRADLEGPHPSTFALVEHAEHDAVAPDTPDHDAPTHHTPTDPTQPGPGQRWSTWRSVAKGQRGPEPVPDWLVTRDAAFDTELGILKTGKEADAFLVERAVPPSADPADVPSGATPARPAGLSHGATPANPSAPPTGSPPHGTTPHGTPPHGTPPHDTPPHDTPPHGTPPSAPAREPERCLLVAKRYRSLDHGQFHRGTEYTEGRRVRRTRDQRAMEDRKSAWGRAVSATQWADAEFVALRDAWSAGAPVPYPVQIDGTEVLMEFVGTEEVDDEGRTQIVAAPRLARERPSDDLLESYWDQLTHGMSVLARLGFAHGDLSPYNILAHGERLVVIDLPQVVDLVANPFASEVLLRDCRTVCAWFTARGLDVDPDALFADLLAQAL